MKIRSEGAQYVADRRKAYSVYVMQNRAIPAMTDGLIHAARRILWMSRSGQKFKSATLAGATMPIHPHASPESTVDRLAMKYDNNITLLAGVGSFGTLLKPTKCGASRYTSVSTSRFTRDVMMRDLDIVPMVDNYDGTEQEPLHFLPLVPVFLLNPHEGMVVGYKSVILPHILSDLIDEQLAFLSGKCPTSSDILPCLTSIGSNSTRDNTCAELRTYIFKGEFERMTANRIRIIRLPYGRSHSDVINTLAALEEDGQVIKVTDKSSDTVDILVEFYPRRLPTMTDDEVLKQLNLICRHKEILNILDASGHKLAVGSKKDLIHQFTKWRLQWFKVRYQHLHDQLTQKIQRLLDVKCVIESDINTKLKAFDSKHTLKQALANIGVVDVEYIADLPTYRFTVDEYNKNEVLLSQYQKTLKEYASLIESETKRKNVYKKELEEIRHQFVEGVYA